MLVSGTMAAMLLRAEKEENEAPWQPPQNQVGNCLMAFG
jgi:hypothetical protein